MNTAKIIGTVLSAVAVTAAIGLFLFIREIGRFAEEIYPYDE